MAAFFALGAVRLLVIDAIVPRRAGAMSTGLLINCRLQSEEDRDRRGECDRGGEPIGVLSDPVESLVRRDPVDVVPPVHGGLTPEVVHPASRTYKLPENVSAAEGAMVEPLAVGLQGQIRCAKAGLDPQKFSAHGLRSGYRTEAANRGIPLPEAMQQSQHK